MKVKTLPTETEIAIRQDWDTRRVTFTPKNTWAHVVAWMKLVGQLPTDRTEGQTAREIYAYLAEMAPADREAVHWALSRPL